jgi:hypothetical protein
LHDQREAALGTVEGLRVAERTGEEPLVEPGRINILIPRPCLVRDTRRQGLGRIE